MPSLASVGTCIHMAYMQGYTHTHTHTHTHTLWWFEYAWPRDTHTHCGGLNMLGPGNGTVRRCGLVGGSVSLWGWALEVSSYLQAPPRAEEGLLLTAF